MESRKSMMHYATCWKVMVFYLEDRGSRLLRNNGNNQTDYTASHIRRQ
jgi:hypothetical protein